MNSERPTKKVKGLAPGHIERKSHLKYPQSIKEEEQKMNLKI
jgi:hypothetical protein